MADSSPRSNFILLGMKHSGKTTLGRRLAVRLHARFADLDDITERIYDPDARISCREIYRRRGKDFFGALEAKAAEQLSKSMTRECVVAALGGGTIENREAMDALKDSGIKVYLKDDPSVLFERIMRGGLPAFLNDEDPRAAFESLYVRRTALFERNADLVVEIDGKDVEEAFGRLLALVERQPTEGQ